MVRRLALALLVGMLSWALPLAPLGATRTPSGAGLEVVGIFSAGAPLNGAMLFGDRLYTTTADRLSIFDVSQPTLPILLSSVASPHVINGEQLSTNGAQLLLNSYETGRPRGLPDRQHRGTDDPSM